MVIYVAVLLHKVQGCVLVVRPLSWIVLPFFTGGALSHLLRWYGRRSFGNACVVQPGMWAQRAWEVHGVSDMLTQSGQDSSWANIRAPIGVRSGVYFSLFAFSSRPSATELSKVTSSWSQITAKTCKQKQ